MKGLTARQEEALSYLRQYRAERGLSPTLRELSEALGMKLESARNLLEALERKGEIRRIPGVSRGIILSSGEALRSEKLAVPHFNAEPEAEDLEEGGGEDLAYIERSLYTNEIFSYTVRSESMRDAGIIPGDLAYLTKDLSSLRNGSIVLAPSDEYGKLELRRYRRLPYCIELAPDNITMGITKATSIQLYGLLIKTERLYN